MLTRRAFLVTGVAGSAALAAAYWLRSARPPSQALAGARGDARSVIAALVPVLLEGALPSEAPQRQSAVARAVDDAGAAARALPPEAQRELAQLFALLAWPPTRLALTGLRSPWAEASASEVQAVLERWRTSRIDLLRSAYDGLHQLILGAWYANPASWHAIGYPGPPQIA